MNVWCKRRLPPDARPTHNNDDMKEKTRLIQHSMVSTERTQTHRHTHTHNSHIKTFKPNSMNCKAIAQVNHIFLTYFVHVQYAYYSQKREKALSIMCVRAPIMFDKVQETWFFSPAKYGDCNKANHTGAICIGSQ